MSILRLPVNGGDGPMHGSGGEEPPARDDLAEQNRRLRRSAESRPAMRDESALAERLAFDDAAALTELAEMLWQPLCRYAAHFVGTADAARDIAQETLVRVWERRHGRPPRSLRAYVFRIARNLAFDQLKRQRKRRRLLHFHGGLLRRRPQQPDEELRSARIAREVRAAIGALAPRRREVFVMAYVQSFSYAEIAEILDISPKTVQNQMTAALAQLRRDLKPLIDERLRGGASEDPSEGDRE